MKILIVDDHSLVREGLQVILNRSELNANYVEAWDATTVFTQLEQHPDIDLMLLDIQLPGSSGLQLLPQIAARHPRMPIIILSSDHDSQTVLKALNTGAAGFLPKTSLNQVLVSAIQLVLAGGIYIPREALEKSAHQPQRTAEPRAKAATFESLGLTARQIEVFEMLQKGLSNKQICRHMDLAEATVKIHVRGILRCLAVNTRAEAMAKAADLGLEMPVAASATYAQH